MKPPPEATVRSVDRLTVHEWTPPDDAVDAPRVAFPDCILRDTALPKGAVEPNPRDATRDALPHHFDGDLGMRGNHHAIHGAWNCGEVRKTPHALDLRGSGIDGQSFVTRVAEFVENGIGRFLAASGDARNGDALPAEEISHGSRKR